MFKKGSWVKRLQKDDDPLSVVYAFASEFMSIFVNDDKLVANIDVFNEEANKMANVARDIMPGMRLLTNWLQFITYRVTEIDADRDGRRFPLALSVKFFQALGWDFSMARSLNGGGGSCIHYLKWLRTGDDGKPTVEQIPILMRPTIKYPIGSIWESTKGKQWELVEICGADFHLEAQEMTESIGKYQLITIGEYQMSRLKRSLQKGEL